MSGDRTRPDEIVVVGGGIGGLATAAAIARRGRPVRVMERAATFGEIGAGLQLAPNATRVLDRLGVLGSLLESAVFPERLVFNDALTGQELTHLRVDEEFRRRYGGPYIVMHRSDLLDGLLAACRRHGVALETHKDVTEVKNLPDRAVVRCADGTEYHGCVVAAADGLRSCLRGALSDDEPIPAGYVAYRGAVPIERATRLSPLTDMAVFIGPGLHFVQYPLRSGRLYNQVGVFRSRRYLAGEDDWGTPEELDEAFAGTCAAVREAVPALVRDNRWAMYDREPIGTWTTGRLVLLGDAAHPMLQYLAQGACQAIEDAAVLADMIDRHLPASGAGTADVRRALLAYQEQRVPRTARAQRTARRLGEIWHTDGLAAELRNELFLRRDPRDSRHFEWLYGEM